VSRQLHLTVAILPHYLVSRGLVPLGEAVAVEEAGAGHINWVRRARIPGHSWIIKQARPALERFPEYTAPVERAAVEARYFETVAPFDFGGVCPVVHQFDAANSVLILEDLGAAEHLDSAQARGADVVPVAVAVGSFLGEVHARTRLNSADLAERFRNREMQRLHGDHIFALPYRENDFPLSPSVASRAREIWRDTELIRAIDTLYARYLAEDANTDDTGRYALVHGDVQPGNILIAEGSPKLLDAEIAHVGDPAFDVGTLVAHLALPAFTGSGDADDCPRKAAKKGVVEAWRAYREVKLEDGLPAVCFEDVARYAGVELLRRTIGAARVAAVLRDDASLRVIEVGRRLMMERVEGVEEFFG